VIGDPPWVDPSQRSSHPWPILGPRKWPHALTGGWTNSGITVSGLAWINPIHRVRLVGSAISFAAHICSIAARWETSTKVGMADTDGKKGSTLAAQYCRLCFASQRAGGIGDRLERKCPFFNHRPDWKSADSRVHAGVAPFLVRTLKVFD